MLRAQESNNLVRDLLAIVTGLYPLLKQKDLDQTWPAVLPRMEAAITGKFDEAARLSASRYTEERIKALGYASQPLTASLDSEALEALRTSLTVVGPVHIKDALSRGYSADKAGQIGLVGLQGVATRTALQGDILTTLDNVAEDEEALGFARIPKPGACPFCLLLATRGGAYKSRETALNTSGRRGKRGPAKGYHDHDRCTVVPIFFEDWEPPKHIQEAEELYNTVTRGKSGKAAIQAFTAAINEQRAGRTSD